MKSAAQVHCGWGRVLFGHTFSNHQQLIDHLDGEEQLRSDVVFYCREPQVLVSKAPQQLFIDPSLTYRLALSTFDSSATETGRIRLRPMMGGWDEHNINTLLLSLGRVDLGEDFTHKMFADPSLSMLLAEDEQTGKLLGCVTGIDHKLAFNDPDNGSSAWGMAIDPDCPVEGVERALITGLAKRFSGKGRRFMDLSIVHDDRHACSLVEQLGFVRVPVYSVKNRNAINEPLYTAEAECDSNLLSADTAMLLDQARRLGLSVQLEDPQRDFFSLHLAGQSVRCQGSMPESSSAVAVRACEDRRVTHALLSNSGVAVPAQAELTAFEDFQAFAIPFRSVDLVPALRADDGEARRQLMTDPQLAEAWQGREESHRPWLAQESIFGHTLNVLVIGNEVFAAEVGTQYREDQAVSAEDGADRAEGGGGTQDVTERLHPALRRAALLAAHSLGLSVVGLEMTVASPCQPDYKVTDVTAQPELTCHSPQPVMEAWLLWLFPSLRIEPQRS
ncbi:hypothetical protein FCL40_09540 [Ferrimonas sediminicola]|uniref:N-acetyltransferase domain-containing protein n=1 Tax=Ferrimonas sediminicola TaxID=2569538 RepID=A0A4U1BD56_9GAMM|nr:hypothetical protein [Ferrimonas sediminicola]TKB48876.1 hypothetical protein FCL40_09540 [Ferrimonas sediminicola]